MWRAAVILLCLVFASGGAARFEWPVAAEIKDFLAKEIVDAAEIVAGADHAAETKHASEKKMAPVEQKRRLEEPNLLEQRRRSKDESGERERDNLEGGLKKEVVSAKKELASAEKEIASAEKDVVSAKIGSATWSSTDSLREVRARRIERQLAALTRLWIEMKRKMANDKMASWEEQEEGEEEEVNREVGETSPEQENISPFRKMALLRKKRSVVMKNPVDDFTPPPIPSGCVDALPESECNRTVLDMYNQSKSYEQPCLFPTAKSLCCATCFKYHAMKSHDTKSDFYAPICQAEVRYREMLCATLHGRLFCGHTCSRWKAVHGPALCVDRKSAAYCSAGAAANCFKWGEFAANCPATCFRRQNNRRCGIYEDWVVAF